MDQFDRSPEDVSFDLDAEEYSLESILDEYKDFQTDAPAPRPQPAYRSRPVTAEMIEEEEAEDAEAEDILMSAELDSALKAADPEAAASAADTPPHEDHDVKRYQPKRQRDHATEEEVEKWNETKANAKRLAKKGISGLKHFASKLSEVVPDEPVTSAEETRALGIEVGDIVCFEPRTRRWSRRRSPRRKTRRSPSPPHRKFRRGYMTPNPNRKSRRACFRP